jgi:glyoxylase-like metal-dependent hydrolase (beta-lactamase superfamily II)
MPMTESAETPPAPTVDPSGSTEIEKGVWVIPDRRVPLVPNVGIVLGDEAALVVDTGMGPANGRLVLDAARAKAGDRSLLLTVTHYHPEHGFGAQVFKGQAEIVYNRAQLDELHAKGDAYVGMFKTFGPAVEQALEGVELVDPDETYSGSHTIDLGGRTVTLREVGVAHTRGDQLVTVDDAGVVFAGDLVEERCFPIFPYFPPDDVDLDGSAWIRVLADLEAQAPAVVVPGHGSPGGAEIVATQRQFMEELRDAAHGAADERRSADEAVADLEPRFHAQHPDWVQPEWVGFGIRYFHGEREADEHR